MKTESKKQELLRAAIEIFLKNGFEKTMMSQISDRAKCSKGTLYSYFVSKEALFLEAVIGGTERESQTVFVGTDSLDASAEELLLRFGTQFLNTLYTPKFMKLRSLAFSGSTSESVRNAVYSKGLMPYEMQLEMLLQRVMERGHLKYASARVASAHLCGLLESEFLLRFLLGTLEPPSTSVLEEAAKRAVKVFIAAYGVASASLTR